MVRDNQLAWMIHSCIILLLLLVTGSKGSFAQDEDETAAAKPEVVDICDWAPEDEPVNTDEPVMPNDVYPVERKDCFSRLNNYMSEVSKNSVVYFYSEW